MEDEDNQTGPSNPRKRIKTEPVDIEENGTEGNVEAASGVKDYMQNDKNVESFELESILSLSTPKLEEGITISDPRNFDASLPKLPRQAHYNRPDKEENAKYLKEIEKIETTIPGQKVETFSDDEEDVQSARGKRYFSSIQVYSKFDFNSRKIDTSKLAVNSHRADILDAIKKNRVIIIDGFTGCGKSTQVPQFIMDKFASENKARCNIIVTQPRRIAALTVARRVSQERGWNLGSVVGYQIGMDKCIKRDETLITYVTTGVLLQKLITNKTLQPYTHIIIDEVHERDLDTDLLLLVIKKILQLDVNGVEKNVKIVLMSATIDIELFSNYFTVCYENQMKRASPVIKITQARPYRVTDYFLEDQTALENVRNIEANLDENKATFTEEICHIAINTICSFDDIEKVETKDPRMQTNSKIYANKQDDLTRNSVLVFLPGFVEIDMMRKAMERKMIEEKRDNDRDLNWTIISLHSSISHDEQDRVFDSPQRCYRKVILSTNIAESSITVPDVVYVIDFCLTKSNIVDTRTNFNCLRMVWASRNQTIQRRGRAGRVRDGKVYKMIPKDFLDKLQPNSPPEMLTASLEFVILKIKELNMGSIRDVIPLALNPPALSLIERAVVNLKEIGALTITSIGEDGVERFINDDGDLTFMGRIMNNLPIPYNCTRLIILGSIFGVMKECMIIAAGLSVKPVFNSPINKRVESYMGKLEWANSSFSDCFAILNLYREWKTKFNDRGNDGYASNNDARKDEHMWRRLNNCSTNVLREIHGQIEQLQERLKLFNITNIGLKRDYYTENEDTDKITATKGVKIKIAIAGAFYPNYFLRSRPDRDYEKERSKEVSGHDLFNTVYLKNFVDSHNGELYAEHIAKKVAYGGLGSTQIKFERSKALVLFDPQERKIGPVNIGVYKAVKMRHCQEPVEFNVLLPNLEKHVFEFEKRKLDTLPYNRYDGHCELPSLVTKEISVSVSYVVSPSQFWIVEKKFESLVIEITAKCNDRSLRLEKLPVSHLMLNCLCLAPFKRQYYRAQIKAINMIKKTARVFFVDYGNTEDVNISELKAFSPQLCQLGYDKKPGYALECRLGDINPSVLHNSVWIDDAKTVFERLTIGQSEVRTRIEIKCVVRSVIIGRLVIENRQEQIVMNDHLIKLEFAERAKDPPYLYEHNILARRRVPYMRSENEITEHNKKQRDEPREMNFIRPPPNASIRMSLKGPWSPLEIKFNSMCQSSTSKDVSIDHQSVNSVILDHEPTAPTSRLLIAASISIQDKSGRISARDTTLMPAIPGLLPLIAMIFCPRIELRTDKSITKYTGVLCGVGVNPEKLDAAESIYPDHDIEIIFDTEFDDEDIERINEIRHLMNLILREDSALNLSTLNKDIQLKTMRLLKRQRKKIPIEVWPMEPYAWNRIRQDYLVPSNLARDSRATDIFTLHSTVKLNQDEYAEAEWTFGF